MLRVRSNFIINIKSSSLLKKGKIYMKLCYSIHIMFHCQQLGDITGAQCRPKDGLSTGAIVGIAVGCFLGRFIY